MAERQLVLAFFPDEARADNAAAALKDSGLAHHDAIGILVLDSHGKLKQDKIGARSTGKGAAIGGVVAVFSTAVLGPAVLAGAAQTEQATTSECLATGFGLCPSLTLRARIRGLTPSRTCTPSFAGTSAPAAG